MLPYGDLDSRDIERYEKEIIGKTFQHVLYESGFLEETITDSKIDYANLNKKGKWGILLEGDWMSTQF